MRGSLTFGVRQLLPYSWCLRNEAGGTVVSLPLKHEAVLLPLRVLLLTVSGWVHREQQDVIDYLVEENRVLREQIGGRRLRLTDHQRRRLARMVQLFSRTLTLAPATS